MKTGIKKILPYFFLVLLPLFLLREGLIPPAGKVIWGWDLNGLGYFWKPYLAENLKSGIIPFWNPYVFSGMPFLAYETFYPLNLLFITIILPFNLAVSLFYFIHLTFAGFFMYWFCRKRFDALSSLAAAAAFALSGLFACRIYSGHPEYVAATAFIPLVFGASVQAVEDFRRKNILLAVFALTMQILVGIPFIVLLTIEAVFLYLLFRFIFPRPQPKIFLNFFFIIAISLGLAAVQLVPFWELAKYSTRSGGLSYGMAAYGSYSWEMFKLFISPFAYGYPFPEFFSYFGPGPNYFEIVYFTGKIAVALLVIYLLKQIIDIFRKKAPDKFFLYILAAILFFALAAMGSNFPLNRFLFDFFPPYKFVRIASRQLIMIVFLLSLSTAVVVSKIKINFIKAILLAVIVMELLYYDRLFIRVKDLPESTVDYSLVKFLKENVKNERVLPNYATWAAFRETYDLNSGMKYGLPAINGYNPVILDNYYRFIDILNKSSKSSVEYFPVEVPPPNPHSPLINFLGVKYVISDLSPDAIGREIAGKFKLVKEDLRYKVYENLKVMPRFFLVPGAEVYPSGDSLGKELIANEPDLSKVILLTQKDANLRPDLSRDLNCEGNNLGTVTLTSYTVNRIELRLKANCNSFLSTSEVYYPGWQAAVDGKRTQIFLSNVAFRAIYVPAGEHKIVFYYSPVIYYIGLLISGGSLVTLILFVRKKI